MDHFFNLIAILIFSCAVQFFYFSHKFTYTKPKQITDEEINTENTRKYSTESEITDEELSPENFREILTII